MSNLRPDLIPLDKGLNLQTAKIAAPSGSVLDTLNYEQVDFQGQKRIDGFLRYDGSTEPSLDEYYDIVLTDPFAWANGSLVATEGGFFGVVVDSDFSLSSVSVAVVNENFVPVPGDTLYVLDEGEPSEANVVVSVTAGSDSPISAEAHYNNLLAYSDVLRSRIEELPGPIAGLHWFRDRLYAVAGVVVASLEGTTPVIYPNDIVSINGNEVKVLEAYVRDNTRLIFVASMNPDEWAVEGTEVFRDAVSMGEIANGFEPILNSEEIATFFESRSEAQVLEEDGPAGPYDYGWRLVDLGWDVRFENGISLYGSLPSLNQNIIGLGVQGPTSIAGTSGRPSLLTQNVDITNEPEQVNGWKSSQTPSSFFLDPDNLTDIDSAYIYADAYLSWDGTTGQVTASTESLVEYPATATVEVEL